MANITNEQHLFAPHDVAGMFDLSAMTVRRWADLYAVHLSPSANPPPGQPRRFTWADVELFRQIKTWRDAGLSPDAINAKLTLQNTDPTVPANMNVTTLTESSQTAPDTPGQAPAPLVAHDYIVALERRVMAVEQSSKSAEQSQRDGWWWLVAGIMIGLGLAAVFEMAAIVASR